MTGALKFRDADGNPIIINQPGATGAIGPIGPTGPGAEVFIQPTRPENLTHGQMWLDSDGAAIAGLVPHKSTHAANGSDPITCEDIGAMPSGGNLASFGSFEDYTVGTLLASLNVGSATVVDTQAWQGTKCGMASNHSAGQYWYFTGYFPVISGQRYTISFYEKRDYVSGTLSYTRFYYNSAMTQIGSTTVSPSTVETADVNGWVRKAYTFISLYTGYVRLASGATVSISGAYYIDGVMANLGSLADYSVFGQPLQNQGIKVTHPNTDDTLINRFDDLKSRWQVEYYNSGIFDISSLLSNGWTATNITIQRTTSAVEVVIVGLNGANSSSSTILTLPVAFRSLYNLVFTIGDTATTIPNHVLSLSSAGVLSISGTRTDVAAGSALLQFNTSAAVPTSLPGTLILAAPVSG